MRIDFHTHTFPAQIADRAIAQLEKNSHIRSVLSGELSDLTQSMQTAGIDYSVLLPVVTNPSQQEQINRTGIELNQHFRETGLLSFGGIHPDNDDYDIILRNLAQNGVRGIKIHPVFQRTYFDDIRYLRIIECACENNLIVVTHAGFDIGFPGEDFVTPQHILPVLQQIKPDKLVLAHTGGWDCWEEVEHQIAGLPVWLDTSFSITPLRPDPQLFQAEQEKGSDTCAKQFQKDHPQLDRERFLRIVQTHGADRILFGSDSPWSSQLESLTAHKKIGLSQEALDAILGGNAQKLLNI